MFGFITNLFGRSTDIAEATEVHESTQPVEASSKPRFRPAKTRSRDHDRKRKARRQAQRDSRRKTRRK